METCGHVSAGTKSHAEQSSGLLNSLISPPRFPPAKLGLRFTGRVIYGQEPALLLAENENTQVVRPPGANF